jgi:hypothetical protein
VLLNTPIPESGVRIGIPRIAKRTRSRTVRVTIIPRTEINMETIWMTTCEVLVEPGDLPSGSTKAFANITTWADSRDMARDKISPQTAATFSSWCSPITGPGTLTPARTNSNIARRKAGTARVSIRLRTSHRRFRLLFLMPGCA